MLKSRGFAKSTTELIEMQDYCLRQMCPIGLMENSGQKINIEMAKWGPQGQNTALLSILMCKAAYLSYQELLILPRIDFLHANYVDHKMIRNITVRKESIKEDTSTLIQKICIL